MWNSRKSFTAENYATIGKISPAALDRQSSAPSVSLCLMAGFRHATCTVVYRGSTQSVEVSMNVFNRKWWFRISLGLLGALVAIQLVPYGRDHTNPPVNGEPAWDSPQTRALARQA